MRLRVTAWGEPGLVPDVWCNCRVPKWMDQLLMVTGLSESTADRTDLKYFLIFHTRNQSSLGVAAPSFWKRRRPHLSSTRTQSQGINNQVELQLRLSFYKIHYLWMHPPAVEYQCTNRIPWLTWYTPLHSLQSTSVRNERKNELF